MAIRNVCIRLEDGSRPYLSQSHIDELAIDHGFVISYLKVQPLFARKFSMLWENVFHHCHEPFSSIELAIIDSANSYFMEPY